MTGSPMTAADRAHLEEWVWTPELFEELAAKARAYSDRLWHTNVEDIPRVEAGPCDDHCGHHPHIRYRIGCFAVCRHCALLRRKAAA